MDKRQRVSEAIVSIEERIVDLELALSLNDRPQMFTFLLGMLDLNKVILKLLKEL